MLYKFPDPRLAPDFAPLCMGGDLSPECLISAYKKGIFPWFMANEPILWWSPNPRAVLFPNEIKIHKSIKPFLRRYSVKFDENFKNLINLCKIERQKEGSWLSDEIVKAYTNLADLGIAHSVEVYENNELIGGLYGLIFGKVFCGESMISIKPNASKVALIRLCEVLDKFGFLIDCQVFNDHLKFMGAKEISRDNFLQIFANLSAQNSGFSEFKDLIK